MLIDAKDIGNVRKDKPKDMSGEDFLKQETFIFVYWMIGLTIITYISRSFIYLF